MDQSNCPFCNSASNTSSYYPDTLFNNKHFSYKKCSACKLIYLSPSPDQNDYIAMYPPSYQQGVNKTILNDPYKKLPGLRFSYGYQFDLVKKYTSAKKMLDYGCGTGNFLANALNAGFECDGAEYNTKHLEILKQEFPSRTFYTIMEFLVDDNIHYDIIRLSNVLEHLDSPVEIISKLVSKLNAGGLLLVEGPIETNFSIAWLSRFLYFKIRKIVNPNWRANHTPTHIFFSNSINQLDFFNKFSLKKIHFEISESEWPYPESVKNASGIIPKLQALTAKISIAISKLYKSWGNTFIFIGKLQ